MRHPELGELVFEHAVFRPDGEADQRLVLYSPLPEHDTAAKVQSLLRGEPLAA
jgi:hypothetical protein